MRKILLMCIVAFLWSGLTFAQDRTITGKVVDESGAPMPGVNIAAKGTTRGTTTDGSGNYSLNVTNDDKVIVFSFIGYRTVEQTIGNQSVINVDFIPDTQTLTEVIVTAQGIEKTKNELSYAAQQVSGEAISKTRDGNFINSLSGKVSGVQITKSNTMGGSTNVVIRGNKSLGGNNQALFVVDGVPIDNSNTNSADQKAGRGGYDYGNASADINSDDIESLTVLKGAAATALYGSRASNGVVYITTKKGSKKGLGVTVNSGINFGTVDKSTFPTYQNQYGGGYGKYYEDASGYFLERKINGQTGLIVPTSEDASYGGAFDPNKQVYLWDAFDPTSPYYNKPHSWTAAANGPITFLKNPVSTNNNIMLDGGGDKGYFKLGYTQNNENGLLPNSNVKKDFLNFSASYNVSSKLTATASINYSNIAGKGRYGTGYDAKNIMGNFRQWWEVNTDIQDQKAAFDRTGKNVTWNWADPDNLTPIYWDNPYFTRYKNYETDNRSRYYGYSKLDYKITDWLNVMGRVSLDSYNEIQEERLAVGSVPSQIVPGGDPQPSAYSKYNRSFKEYNYDVMINFNKNLSQNFNLKAVLGSNVRKNTIESTYNTTNGGLTVPDLYSLSNSLNAPNPATETYSDRQINGLYGNLTLGYKNMLFLDLAGRRDKASTLPSSNNTYYYPSASLSFVFSELMKSQTWLTFGKIRLNYAAVGGDAPTRSLKDVYDKPVAFGSNALFSVPGIKNNPNLKPEGTSSYEAGIEMSFLDSRLGFDVTYYKQNTINQILAIDVSRTTGYNQRFVNSGNVENKGFEVTAFVVPIKTPTFSWTVNLNWTRNRNKVLELYNGSQNYLLASLQGGVSLNAAVGEPYGTIKSDDFIYKNGQKVVDQATGYYKKTSSTDNVLGNYNPKWIGGIYNTFKYKGLSLGFLIDIKKGGDMFSLDMYYGLATGLYPETALKNDLGNPSRSPVTKDANSGGVILPGVKDDGTPNTKRASNSNYGLYGYRRNPAAAFVYDAGFVKLREVSLSYSLPKFLVSKLGIIKSIDVSFIGRNLWIIQKSLPYADPEDQISSGNVQGYQTGSYPNLRNYGFNAKFRF